MLLTTKTPCCGRKVSFRATPGFPEEVYHKTCMFCQTSYSVRRTIVLDAAGVRADKLEWLDTKSTEHTRQYGA